MMFNGSLAFNALPLYVGLVQGCLSLTNQTWLSIIPKHDNYSHSQLHLLSGLNFKYNLSNNTKKEKKTS